MSAVSLVFVFLCVIGITQAGVTFSSGNCVNGHGHSVDAGKTWYNQGECARYGCFVKNDVRIQYRETESMDALRIVIFLTFVPGIAALITFTRGNCVNGQGHEVDSGTTWFNQGECAKYGCFVKNDERIQYKETCPDYPIPKCNYHLKKDVNGPFPECCDVPVCAASPVGRK